MTRIAVIVPHYQQVDFLEQCLDSLFAQTRVPDEIVVVDSSSDATATIMNRYGNRVRHLVRPASGVAAARNAGLAATTCELVAFLDADNVALANRIERHLAVFARDPGIVLSHGALVPIDRHGSSYTGVARYASEQVPFGGQLGWLIARNRIATDTVCARRDAIVAVGGFCEQEGVREDYDLWLRLATGGRFHCVDVALTQYRRHESNLSNDEAYMFEWEAGALRRVEWGVIVTALRRAFPDRYERSLIEAEVRLRRGERGEAERRFRMIARGPRAAGALFHLAHLALDHGAIDRAEATLRQALAEDPLDAGLWNNLGVACAQGGKAKEAERGFRRAVHLRPHYRDALWNLDHSAKEQNEPADLAWKVTRRRLRPQLLPLAAVA